MAWKYKIRTTSKHISKQTKKQILFGLKEIENSKLCFIRREIVNFSTKIESLKNFTDSENSTNGNYFSMNEPSWISSLASYQIYLAAIIQL